MFGWLPDTEDKRDLPFDFLSAQQVPPQSSLEHRCVPIPNQLGTLSCVGQAARQAFGVEEARENPGREPVSALGMYFNARAEYGLEDIDSGTTCRASIKSAVKFGPLREKDWPFNPAHVNRRPSWRAYRNAHDGKGPQGYYRITETGDARLDAIRRAIAAEHPVLFGTNVTEGFTFNDGPSRIERPGSGEPIAGGHAMCVVGYDESAFRIANSWGTGWRDQGFAWLAESYMAWDATRDLWVIVV